MSLFDEQSGQNASFDGQDVNGSKRKRRGLSERQENFCQNYIVCGTGVRAAINAGYAPATARQQASRLLTKAYIVERIATLRRDLGIRNRIDTDTIMAKLEAAYRGAMTGHMYFTAVRAAEAQARLAGLIPDRPSMRARMAKKSRANGANVANPAPEKVNGGGAPHPLARSHAPR